MKTANISITVLIGLALALGVGLLLLFTFMNNQSDISKNLNSCTNKGGVCASKLSGGVCGEEYAIKAPFKSPECSPSPCCLATP